MFASVGPDCYIEPPLHANWDGHHVHFGRNVYANFNLTLVDDTYIYVGDYTMIGPNVVIATAGHPILPTLREYAYQYNASVSIGRNCWLGAGVIVLPGVTIGENSVIGAGEATAEKMKQYRLVVWSNHGIYGTGRDMDEAFGLIETVEKTTQIYMLTLGHNPQMISDDILWGLADRFSVIPIDGVLQSR